MSFIQEPTYIIAVLLLLIVFSEWLAGKRFFRNIGSILIIIIAAAILANLAVIPSSYNAPPLYDGIFQYAAPLGIFFLLLQVKLKNLKTAGLPMMLMFLIGSAATMTAAIVGFKIFSPENHINLAHAVAGMYTGTYTGGSVNLNAVALHYQVNKEGVLYAAVNAVDNILTTIWIIVTLVLPKILRRFIPRKRKLPSHLEGLSDEEIRTNLVHDASSINLPDLAVLLALGFGSMFISSQVSQAVPWIPSILVLTTLALVFAQIPYIQKLQGGRVIAMILIMLFLAVIGAFCDLNALMSSGSAAGILLVWVTFIVFFHGFIIFAIGGLLKQDWDIIAIASNANIGGATSAPVCAVSIGRPDLQLPGLLAGTVGTAVGTYLGFIVAEFLK